MPSRLLHRLRRWRPQGRPSLALLALGGGALGVPAFAPFGIYPLAWLSAAVLYGLCIDAPRARDAALYGGLYGLGFFGVGVSWVYVSLHDVGGMPMPLAAVATLLFVGVLALFSLLAGWGLQRTAPGGTWNRYFAPLLFAAVWALCESLRGWVFTGFPWLALGVSQTPPSPLAGFVPLIGATGVSFLVALLGGVFAEALFAWRSGQLVAVVSRCGVATAVIVCGTQLQALSWTQAVGSPLTVSLLQGNVAQEMKWRPETYLDSLATYEQLLRDHPARLVVLPETALPSFYDQLPPAYLAELRRLLGDNEALLGVPLRDTPGQGNYYNGAVTLSGQAQYPVQTYAKAHLVPFGEFVPAGFGWFLAQMNMPLSGFTPGPEAPLPLNLAGQKAAVNICYEDVFAGEIARRAEDATLFINLSNTAWFGHSLAQPQHLQIARMRALETGRPMLRATNTGMTAAIDGDGRVLAQLPPFSRGALTIDVRGRSGVTPYVRLGEGGVILLILGCLLGGLFAQRRRDN